MKHSHCMGGKLKERWKGPSEVTKVMSKGRFQLKSKSGNVLSKVYHEVLLKAYRQPGDDTDVLHANEGFTCDDDKADDDYRNGDNGRKCNSRDNCEVKKDGDDMVNDDIEAVKTYDDGYSKGDDAWNEDMDASKTGDGGQHDKDHKEEDGSSMSDEHGSSMDQGKNNGGRKRRIGT